MAEKPQKQATIVKSLVLNDKGEILFVKRNWKERPDVHGKWEFPGGGIDFGEQSQDTAIREAKEESGYDVKIIKLIPKILNFSREMEETMNTITVVCYLCKLTGGEMTLGDHGVSEIKWFKENNLPKKEDCLKGTYEFLEEYKKSHKSPI